MARPHGAADPRAQITPDSFTVAAELLGLPLARPWRRALAMLIDLFAVAILANAGGVFLAFAAAFALWRASGTGRKGFARGALRFTAALALFIGTLSVIEFIDDRTGDPEPSFVDAAGNVNLGLNELQLARRIMALTVSGDTAAVRQAARDLAAGTDGAAMDEDDRRDMVAGILDVVEDPEAKQILRAALDASAPAPDEAAPDADSAAIRYAAALGRGDTAEARTLRPVLTAALARDTIDRLARSNTRLEQRYDRLEEEMEELEERRTGFTGFIRAIAEDLGIGFGWGALYFTAFLALWRGQTPGKRLLGVRVIRLDGRPIGWWIAFERFGGYGASLVTGLLGFAQILWDRNRQGLHDKSVETVVIRDLPPSIRAEGTWQPAGRS